MNTQKKYQRKTSRADGREGTALLKATITSTYGDGENAIYIDVYTKKGMVRALIDNGSKLDLIDLEIV